MEPQSLNYSPLSNKIALTNIHDHSRMEQELAKVTKQIYERNVELSISNRIFSVLRTIYNIINLSLDIDEASKRLIEAIVTELRFQKGFIAIIDKQANTLKSIGVSSLKSFENRTSNSLSEPFDSFSVSLDREDNVCVHSIKHAQRQMTNFLYDILGPTISEKEANQIALTLNIKTSLVYPIIFAGEPLGVMVLSMDKHIGYLSRAERDTLREIANIVTIGIERTKVYADLKALNHRLQEVDKLKDEFVSIASHELRTPMTAIKSYLWMALHKSKEPLSDQVKRYLDIAYISTERLLTLVQDMLTVSRIEGNRLNLVFEQTNVYDLALQIYNELKISADEKKINFTIDKPSETFLVNADKEKLGEVFQNLMGNALKFTPNEGKISVLIHRDENDNNKVVFEVTDTGPGISEEGQTKLFQKFSKLEESYAQVASSSGTGLGLYISKQIVNYHQGSISVKSEVGKGSTFSVALPLLVQTTQ